jgi:hypothetical protein
MRPNQGAAADRAGSRRSGFDGSSARPAAERGRSATGAGTAEMVI